MTDDKKTPAQIARAHARKLLAKGITPAVIAQGQLLVQKWNELLGVPMASLSESGMGVCIYIPDEKGESWLRHTIPLGHRRVGEGIKNATRWMIEDKDKVAKMRHDALKAYASSYKIVDKDHSWN